MSEMAWLHQLGETCLLMSGGAGLPEHVYVRRESTRESSSPLLILSGGSETIEQPHVGIVGRSKKG